jgi:hypothetical protein
MKIDIVDANLKNEEHTNAIIYLLNEYAKDLQGYKRSLPENV